MSRVPGTVVELRDGRVIVECRDHATAACGACASGRGCSWRRISRSSRLEVPVSREVAFAPGDRVELEVNDGRLLGAALRLYLPPLAGLLAGPILLHLTGQDGGTGPAAAAALGLLGGFAFARRWTRRAPAVELHRA
jgi:sigma-E factor negative regulatory protein RseC